MKKYIASLLAISLITGCSQESENQKEVVRSVKYTVVGDRSMGQVRKISGVVKTLKRTELSFEVDGRVEQVYVKAGETVEKGQLLAKLEKRDFELKVQAAKAKLESAETTFIEQENNLSRKKQLQKEGYLSRSKLEQAKASFESAKTNVSVYKVELENATRDLERTELVAPFSGKISEKIIEPFVDIQRKQVAFELQGDEGLKVESLVPESLVSKIQMDDKVTVTYPTLKDVKSNGHVYEIGADVSVGNAYTVTASIENPTDAILNGMTAEVHFIVDSYEGSAAVYTLPISAFILNPENQNSNPQKGYVYVYDEDSSKLRKQEVLLGKIKDNSIEVISGLHSGDFVVTAGVPYLVSGQKVRLWNSKYSNQ